MKLSLKIMTALLIFAVIGITSCSKNQFGLDEEESTYSETESSTANLQHDAKVKQITSILENMEGVKITKNYTNSEKGMTGTLYEYIDDNGITQRVVKLDKNPETLGKSWYPSIYTATALPDGNGGWIVVCTGAADDCIGWEGTIWWLNW